ncbi:hypothetical protein VNO77_50618 [Canavalia gladiata]|uniref:DUF3444 domain-containing protein n=1 Tax=Canavalia gladiata TaxID=3824 RepID=A0AAN9JCE3_CANGL
MLHCVRVVDLCDGTATNFQNSFYSQSQAWNAYHQADNQTFWTSHDMGNHNVPPGYWSPFNNQKEPPKHASSKKASKSNGGKSSGREQEGVSMSKWYAGIGTQSKVAKSRDGHVAVGVTNAGVGTSNPTNSKPKESQSSTRVGRKRARQSASDDDNKAGTGKGVKDAKVQENRVDPNRRSSRKKQHVSYTKNDKDGDFGSSSKRPRHHESFTSTEMEKREVPTTGGLFRNNNPASVTAGVGGQNGEIRNKASAPPEETVLRNKTKVEQTNVQRKEASNSDLNDRKSKADNCSPMKSNLPPSSEICCPDPDFSDFERDKAEDCFAVNQLWAIFDNTDSMPRFYALVNKVYSPFKLRIIWLEPDSDDQGEIDWHEAGLPVACGKFKLGHSQRTSDRFMFSHQMHCIKGSDTGTYLLHPKKGETWAIFRHWDLGWSSNPEKHSEYQFEYVEVLSDFDENVGIKVTYLSKLKGRSPRSSQKSLDNGQATIGQYAVRKDDINIGHRDDCPPEGNTAPSQTNEGETLKARKSPRDLSKKNIPGDAGEWTIDKKTDNHLNNNKNMKGSNIPQSVGASCYGFKKEKSEEMFQCGQIWAIYGDRDHMPDTYVQIKIIERTPNFRLQCEAAMYGNVFKRFPHSIMADLVLGLGHSLTVAMILFAMMFRVHLNLIILLYHSANLIGHHVWEKWDLC